MLYKNVVRVGSVTRDVYEDRIDFTKNLRGNCSRWI